jgi:peroxiredoxin
MTDEGPKLGDAVRDFEARDQNGTPRSLASLTGAVGLVLVVVRSADW